MRTVFSILLCATVINAAEVEFELVTGSKFKGTLQSVTPRMVVVETAIGELKLTPSMLSRACRGRVAEMARAGISDAPLPELDIEVSYRAKTLEREKDTHRRGGSREVKRQAGVLKIEFGSPPRDRTLKGYVEYSFTAEMRGLRERGQTREYDRGRKEFTLDPTTPNEPIEIVSKPLTHVEAEHTGDTIREQGVEPEGYTVKVVIDGQVVYEAAK